MHRISSFVFWVTLFLYIITLLTVSYVGVYLTYIAIPLIVVSGLIMMISKPKNTEESSEISKNNVKEPSEIRKAAIGLLTGFNDGLNSVSSSLQKYNDKQAYINIVVGPMREELYKLHDEKRLIDFTYNIEHSLHGEELIAAFQKEAELRKPIQLKIDKLTKEISDMKEQRALEYEELCSSIQE